MSPRPRHSEPDLPPPSAELILFREAFAVLVEALPKRKRAKVMRTLGERLMALPHTDDVILIRPTADHPAVLRARRQAKAFWIGVWGGSPRI